MKKSGRLNSKGKRIYVRKYPLSWWTEERLKPHLMKFGIDHLHYMAPLNNVPLMLAMGILSYNKARRLPHEDISLWSVQERRESPIPGTDKRIHDYVPFYFAIHTPMQYVISRGTERQDPTINQRNLVFIEVDAVKIFRTPGVIFTDGNAAAEKRTCFYSNPADLDKLDWKVINTRDCYWSEYKRKKAAEVLVPDNVDANSFTRIVVFNPDAAKDLIKSVQTLCEKLKAQYPVLLECISIDTTHYY
jgi:hypothetical protein